MKSFRHWILWTQIPLHWQITNELHMYVQTVAIGTETRTKVTSLTAVVNSASLMLLDPGGRASRTSRTLYRGSATTPICDPQPFFDKQYSAPHSLGLIHMSFESSYAELNLLDASGQSEKREEPRLSDPDWNYDALFLSSIPITAIWLGPYLRPQQLSTRELSTLFCLPGMTPFVGWWSCQRWAIILNSK